MGKVVHVSGELHAKLTKFCREKGVSLKDFAEQVLLKFMERDQTPVPVPQKKLETANEPRRDGPFPWELPPFWKRGERVEGDSQEDKLEEVGSAAQEGAGGGEGQLPQAVEDAGECEIGEACSSREGDNQAAQA